MKPRIGLIQPGGIGDIIIALPIAKYFVDKGFDVFYPIHKYYMSSFVEAAPYVNFIALEDTKSIQDAILTPQEILGKLACSQIFNLISYINGNQELLTNKKLAEFLKFDQYKYAVTGVPFKNKWKLQIERNLEREEALCIKLDIDLSTDYCVTHLEGSNFKVQENQIRSVIQNQKIINIENLTDNIFDWLTIIENAESILMIDSCYANLVEQLNIDIKKILILRSPVAFTPVFVNDWQFTYLTTN